MNSVHAAIAMALVMLTRSFVNGAEVPTKDAIVAKWQLTEANAKRATIEWNESHVGPASGDAPPGQRESASNWTLHLSANDFKAIKVQTRSGEAGVQVPNTTIFKLDGQGFTVFRSKIEEAEHPGAIVDRPNKFASTLELRAPFLHLRPTVSVLSEMDVANLQVKAQTATFDGKEYAVLVSETLAGERRTEYWVDPARNFAIARQLRFAADQLTLQLDLAFGEESHDGVPDLTGWAYSKFQADGSPLSSSRFEVTKFDVNPQFTDEELSVEFPVGTLVNDHTGLTESRYIVRPNNERRAITDAEMGATYEDWVATESGKAQRAAADDHLADRFTMWVVGGIIVAALAVMAMLAWLFARRGTRK